MDEERTDIDEIERERKNRNRRVLFYCPFCPVGACLPYKCTQVYFCRTDLDILMIATKQDSTV